jgi:hypothetical protein
VETLVRVARELESNELTYTDEADSCSWHDQIDPRCAVWEDGEDGLARADDFASVPIVELLDHTGERGAYVGRVQFPPQLLAPCLEGLDLLIDGGEIVVEAQRQELSARPRGVVEQLLLDRAGSVVVDRLGRGALSQK